MKDSSIFACRMWLFVFILISCVLVEVKCANATDKTTLNAALLTGYNPNVLPGSDYSTQLLNINVSFMFSSLQSFVEVTGELSIVGYFEIFWKDERLAWDPATYNYVNGTHLKQKEIWTPPFMLVDSAEDVKIIGDEDMHLSVDYTGVVMWSPPARILSACDADVTYYPFDRQTCVMRYMPWGYTASEIQLNVIYSSFLMDIFSENPTWKLISTGFKSVQTPFLRFEMSVQFERRNAFFVVNLILPIIFMCLTNMFVFLIPADSGDRMGFSTTLLLTIAVFLSIVTAALPQSSTPSISLLCYLLIVHILLSMLVMICTIIGLRMFMKPPEEPVPKWLAKLTRFVHVITCKKHKVNPEKTEKKDEVEDMTENDDKKVDDYITWIVVSNAFDKICMGFFMMTAMSFNLTFLFVLSTSS
ncbi:neuronal acetylcholine receptor subunit alpha-6-like [Ylistrum balloti]|uniref:neuronal acetylcholine receptor subunit alpha-6-like n=1 Tax=Ylistrum balloti TaxID=509963 RepID=UPI002905A9D5|nr:neuronal acetylcholine receptor subunit alpha-6-like [Ylistrum balloti]